MEMNKTYSVIVSKRATQMLVSHAAFLAKVSLEAANRLVASFEETANSLATMPERCSWLIADYIPPNKYRKILFEKRYLLLFQIIDHTVYTHDGKIYSTQTQMFFRNVILGKTYVLNGVTYDTETHSKVERDKSSSKL